MTAQDGKNCFHNFSAISTNRENYKPVNLDIIERTASTEMVNITTDMGSPNPAIWRTSGVDKISVPHPPRPDSRLYITPDVLHLVKKLSVLVHLQFHLRQ